MTEGLDKGDPPIIAVFDDTANSGAEFVAASLAVEVASAFAPPNGLPLSIVASAGG